MKVTALYFRPSDLNDKFNMSVIDKLSQVPGKLNADITFNVVDRANSRIDGKNDVWFAFLSNNGISDKLSTALTFEIWSAFDDVGMTISTGYTYDSVEDYQEHINALQEEIKRGLELDT